MPGRAADGPPTRLFRSRSGPLPIERLRTFGEVSVSFHRPGPGHWRWTGSRGPRRTFMTMVLRLSGALHLMAPMDAVDAAPAGCAAVLLPHEHPADLWAEGADATWAVLWIPAPMMRRAGTPVETATALKRSALLEGARAFILAAAGGPQTPSPSPRSPTRRTLDERAIEKALLGFATWSSTTAAPAPEPADPLDRAHGIILRNLHDPSFTSARLVEELRMSERSVQRLFSRHGTTPSRELRRLRAEVARSALRERRATRTPVPVIARDAGFGSVSAMRRALAELGRPGDDPSADSDR